MTDSMIPQSGTFGSVDVTVAEGIATVRFTHPKGNSLPAVLLARLASEIRRVGAADDVRVIVLRSGETGPFCAGASFEELKGIRDAAGGKEFFMGFARVILAMTRCPKIIVARVHGKTVGGGVGLVAASDYTMAVETASLRLSELAIGIGPFVVGPVIERKIGLGGFGAMAIDADWRSARWAEEFGLYSKVFDSVNALDSGLESFSRKLARSNPQALAQLKAIFWQGTGDWERLLEARAEMSGSLVTSEFTRNAIAAFDQGARS
ncbi:MAG TPA: enoyl-CoA hydratase/isomerase family protein [Gemmatimonadaceae bacterium]|nr:enoyl-CoA hydratase/isomerase family protein [Gemmatimonadaceae bacterium]